MDNFLGYPIDILYARVDTTYINHIAKGATEMTDQEMRDTICQMLKDWDNATDEQRAEALAIAAAAAEAATR